MEKQDMRVLTLDPYQHGVVINHLFSVRIHSARGRSERSGGHTGVVLHWRADF